MILSKSSVHTRTYVPKSEPLGVWKLNVAILNSGHSNKRGKLRIDSYPFSIKSSHRFEKGQQRIMFSSYQIKRRAKGIYGHCHTCEELKGSRTLVS